MSVRNPFNHQANAGKQSSQSAQRKQAPASEKRPSPFCLRLSSDERRQLEQQAGSRPLGEYIRHCALGDRATKRRKSRKPTVDHQKLAFVLAQLGQSRLSQNINQLAKAANTGTLELGPDTEASIQQACAEIIALRAMLIEALGLQVDHER